MARSDRVRLNGDRVKAAASPPSWALGANAIFGRVASESPGWCGRTVVLAGWDGQARGAVAVADTVKPSAAAAVVELRRLGLRTVLLTGDSQLTAQAVAAGAGTDEVIAGALPDYKVAVIRDLQARGRRVAMVGDGINDGPALATADLGLALGTGTDVAITAADLIVLREDLNAIPDAISLARVTLSTIRGNLTWGVRLEHSGDPGGGRRVPQPADRGRGDDPVFGVRGRQQRAATAVRGPTAQPTGVGQGPAGQAESAVAGEQVALCLG